jgi:SOS-response transcriptional repressor LexA
MTLKQNVELHSNSQTPLINNLKLLMAEAGTKEAELARRTHIPQPTLHKILSGKTADPRYSTLQSLAEFFGLTIDELHGEEVAAKFSGIPSPKKQTQSVPIITWTNCIDWKQFISDLNANNWNNWIVIESDENDLFGLISKPCLEPRFPRDTTLIISPQTHPQDGDLVVVHYPETDEATLRELSIDGPNRLLHPLNTNSSPDTYNEKIKILGILLQSRFIYHK